MNQLNSKKKIKNNDKKKLLRYYLDIIKILLGKKKELFHYY